jgi:hypothetical protein
VDPAPLSGRLASRPALALAILVVGTSPTLAQAPAPTRLLAEARSIAGQMASIRGLPLRQAIDFQVSDRASVRAYAEASLSRQMPAEGWAAYQALLVHTGLIPAGTDLEELVVQLYTEQIAGYYDPARKTFYLADWLPELLQRGVVAHEVTHALQDQHFGLERWLAEVSPSEDGSLARAAVAEGDAMMAMIAYMLEPMGATVEDLPPLSRLLAGQSGAIADAYPSFESAPPALQRLLLFPYVEGSDFVRAALARGGWASVDRLYRDPPSSTEQILHPDRYFEARDEPRLVELPAAEGEAPLLSGSWGEFGTRLVLAASLADSALPASAALGWDGDRYGLWRTPDGGLRYLWVSVWDGPGDAERFADAYAQGALDRARPPARITTGAGRFELTGGDRTLVVRREGDRVEIRETSRFER